jgi:TatA/E family protein of Tat protein translocase
MFSVPDILVVSVLALLLFGPDRLPKLMRQAGRFMREVQNTSHGFISEMERAADLADNPVPPPMPYQHPAYETTEHEATTQADAPPVEHAATQEHPPAAPPAGTSPPV